MSLKQGARSYGLTFAAGLPLPPQTEAGLASVRQYVDEAALGGVVWYTPATLHITLAAPIRSRYRAGPPLTLGEMPADLAGFADRLNETFSGLEPATATLGSIGVGEDGILLIHVHGSEFLRTDLLQLLRNYPEFDPPKHDAHHLHISLGFLGTARSIPDVDTRRLSTCLPVFSGQTFEIRRVWLVHYADRSLNSIVGKVAFDLGKPNHATAETLVQDLQLAISETAEPIP